MCTDTQTFSLHVEFTPALSPARDLSLSQAEWLPRSAKAFRSLFFCLKQHMLGYFLIIPAFLRNSWCKGEEMVGWTPQENAPTHWMTTFAAFHLRHTEFFNQTGLQLPAGSEAVWEENAEVIWRQYWDAGRSCSTETGPRLHSPICYSHSASSIWWLPGVAIGLVVF